MKTILLTVLCLGALSASAQMPDDSANADQKPAATQPNKLTADVLKSGLNETGGLDVALHLMLNGKPLIKSLGQADYEPDHGYQDIVINLNADGKTITYSAKKRVGLQQLQLLTIDSSNKQEIEALTTLLTAYKDHVVGQPCGNFARDDGGTEMKPLNGVQNQALSAACQAYHGAFGECVGLTGDYGSTRQLPDLRFHSSQGTDLGLPEPLTLLYIVKHQSEFWQMQEQAIADKHTAEAAAQQQAEAAAKAEIENAKAAAAARVKAAGEQSAAEIAKLNQQKELDKIAEEEAAQKVALQQKVLQAKSEKISAFLATKEGTLLKKEIQAKTQEINEKKEKETAYLRDLSAKVMALKNKLSATKTIRFYTVQDVTSEGARVTTSDGNDYFIYGLTGVYSDRFYSSPLNVKKAPDFAYTTVIGATRTIPGFKVAEEQAAFTSAAQEQKEAETNYHESPELVRMRQELEEMLKKFEQGCGVSYDEAMTIQGTSKPNP
jgi:hypothetical protein